MSKIDCYIIKDLLPLYVDEVVSTQTKNAIEEHILACNDCQKELNILKKEINTAHLPSEFAKGGEPIMKIRKHIHRNYCIIAIMIISILFIGSFCGVSYLRNNVKAIAFNNNIEVNLDNGNIIAEIEGTSIHSSHIVNIPVNGEETEFYTFFFVESSNWDNLISKKSTLSKVTIAYNDKGAENISKIYYYTGEYDDITNMSVDELQLIISNSTLLWQR
ncbi:zf-HC2 domain-containing protein [Anaerotignum sp.]|uniref:zf-HC2 domain-containing protein n=1 Tax=Anaerotignum sp. TaxID=2039241 RepID=UPI0028990CDA|nr:zf-HC2 domain-containing protein [Anaerotignum sp.]